MDDMDFVCPISLLKFFDVSVHSVYAYFWIRSKLNYVCMWVVLCRIVTCYMSIVSHCPCHDFIFSLSRRLYIMHCGACDACSELHVCNIARYMSVPRCWFRLRLCVCVCMWLPFHFYVLVICRSISRAIWTQQYRLHTDNQYTQLCENLNLFLVKKNSDMIFQNITFTAAFSWHKIMSTHFSFHWVKFLPCKIKAGKKLTQSLLNSSHAKMF